MIEAVIFDLDGVLLHSEEVWDEVREKMTRELGGTWHSAASRDMMGMSSPEWSRYMNEQLGINLTPQEINDEAVRRMRTAYADHLPLIPAAGEAVARMAANWPLGLASSSNRPLIDTVLEVGGLAEYFQATVSSEEVERGKPAPDVFLAVASEMAKDPRTCAAIEDSHTGIQSASSAGMAVVAFPNAAFPPGEEALDLAATTIGSLTELSVELIEGLL